MPCSSWPSGYTTLKRYIHTHEYKLNLDGGILTSMEHGVQTLIRGFDSLVNYISREP